MLYRTSYNFVTEQYGQKHNIIIQLANGIEFCSSCNNGNAQTVACTVLYNMLLCEGSKLHIYST